MKRVRISQFESEKQLYVTGNVLGGVGNDNIRAAHAEYFENRILEKKEHTTSDITLAPNYYAWLCLITEHVFWRMRQFCYRQSDLEHEILALNYNTLIAKYFDVCRDCNLLSDEELRHLYELVVKVLELRHAVIHKGFPNLLPVTLTDRHVRNLPKFSQIDASAKFTEASMTETIEWYSNPQNYAKIKEEFDYVRAVMSKAPGFSVEF